MGVSVQSGVFVFVGGGLVEDAEGGLVWVGGEAVLDGQGVLVTTAVLVGSGVLEGVQVIVGVLVGRGVLDGSGVMLGGSVFVGGGGGVGVNVVVGVAVGVQVIIVRGTALRTSWQPFWKSIMKPKSELRASGKGPPPPQSPSKSISHLLEDPALKLRLPLQIVLES